MPPGDGSIDKGAPEHIRKVFAVETLLTGVAPWPASEEAIALYKIPEPLRSVGSLQRIEGGATTSLDASRAAGEGESVRIPASGAVLLRMAR